MYLHSTKQFHVKSTYYLIIFACYSLYAFLLEEFVKLFTSRIHKAY